MSNVRAVPLSLARAAVCAALVFAATGTVAQPRKSKPRPQGSPKSVAPTSIEVTVVQVEGAQAFLQPGTAGGVHRGARVVIGQNSYTVVQTSDSFAVIDVGEAPPSELARGLASATGVEEEKAKELPAPRPLSAWRGQWVEAQAPADSQTPRFVPLGNRERSRRFDVRLSVSAGATLPLGSLGTGVEFGELNALVHAEPLDAPAALDLDVSLQQWLAADLGARAGGPARPTLWLRELLFSYAAHGWYGGLGRMRYAASSLGTLDGARVRAPLGEGFSLAAFGGLLPNPLSGEPSASAQRFGVEATYSRPDVNLRPEAALVLHGSTFGGAVDERRVSGTVAVFPGHSRLGGYFEISGFDADNAWRAPPIAWTAAGVDASVHFGAFEVGGRVDVRQPERSRWLASFLPTSWLCRTAASPTGGDVCDATQSTPAAATVDASAVMGNVSVTLGATTTQDLTQPAAPQAVGAFGAGRVVRIAQVARVDASASLSQATYLTTWQASAGPGITLLGDVVDLSFYYRLGAVNYRLTKSSLATQGVGTSVGIFPNAEVVFAIQGEATLGDDSKTLLLFGTAMWRPRL